MDYYAQFVRSKSVCVGKGPKKIAAPGSELPLNKVPSPMV